MKTALLTAALLAGAALSALPPTAAAQAPANDDCAGATAILTRRGQATFQTVSTAGATPSVELACTATGNDDDVWFSFVAAGPGLRLEYADLTSTAASPGLGYALYDGCGGALLACDYAAATGASGSAFVDLAAPLTPGATYFLALYTTGAGEGSFAFRLTAHQRAPIAANPGDACATATVTLDGSGGMIDALDARGGVIASIGNDEDLGPTTVSLRGHGGAAPREASGARLYDRNISVTPTRQPTRPIRVDLYVTTPEFQRLAAVAGTSATFADYVVAQVPGGGCSPTLASGGAVAPLGRGLDYPGGYRLSLEVSQLSEFFLVTAAVPTPVDLLAFAAAPDGPANRITWRVANEEDLARYVVERTDAPSADADWTAVATLAARGTHAGQELDYAATDAAPLPMGYYRLRQVDLDGSEAVSEVVAVDRGGDAAASLTLYPTRVAVGGAVTASLPGAWSRATVAVRDAGGRTVRRYPSQGGAHRTLDLADLPAGVYVVSFARDDRRETRRLVVQ